MYNGYIVNFGSVSYNLTTASGSTFYSADILKNEFKLNVDPGTTNLRISYFPNPILTQNLFLGDIQFKVVQGSYGPNDVRLVTFEIELFGCSNYVIEKGQKSLFCTNKVFICM